MIKDTFYTDNFMTGEEVRRASKASPRKLHQKTCPTCARKLINIYYKSGMWKCKKCWDAFNTWQDSLNEGE